MEAGVPKWLQGQLDDEQLRAVTAPEQAVMVLAGAGSGKTRSFAYRVAWLIKEQGVPPWRILALSFTNKAALEMSERVGRIGERLGDSFHRVQCSTFHSTGARLLRQYAPVIGLSPNFVVLDESDSKRLLNVILKEKGLDSLITGNLLSDWVGRHKDSLRSMDSLVPPAGLSREQAVEIFLEYESRLIQSNGCDFADLIRHLVLMAGENREVAYSMGERFLHVLVDEYQDTNASQQVLLKVLTGERGNIWVVGDEDQSIYGWRGADPANMNLFLKEYEGAALYRLQHNYRSIPPILAAADGVIKGNKDRIGKILIPFREGEEQIQVVEGFDGREEARLVVDYIWDSLGSEPDRDVGILYRVNSQSRLFEEELVRRGLPFRVVGGVGFYERAEVKDLLAYARVAVNPDDEISLRRIINNPRRGIGPVSVAAIAEAGGGAGFAAGLRALATGMGVGKAPRSINKITEFYGLIEQLREGCQGMNALSALNYIYDRVGFGLWLTERGEVERLDNIRELLNAAGDWVIRVPDMTLAQFLEQMALVSAVDKVEGSARANISLLTVHAAKGLEFSNVCLVGFEDGLFPLIRDSYDHDTDYNHDVIEEERRLAYVALTRAKDKLHISHAAYRFRNGLTKAAVPSRFLHDIPLEVLKKGVVRVDDVSLSVGGLTGALSPAYFTRPSGKARLPEAGRSYSDSMYIDPDYSHMDYDQDYQVQTGLEGLGPGTLVEHRIWGEGEVISVSASRKLRVQFQLGIKRVDFRDVVVKG